MRALLRPTIKTAAAQMLQLLSKITTQPTWWPCPETQSHLIWTQQSAR